MLSEMQRWFHVLRCGLTRRVANLISLLCVPTPLRQDEFAVAGEGVYGVLVGRWRFAVRQVVIANLK